MTAEKDRALTYYVDSSVWNQLSHQPEPGRPECVARLKRARDENQAQTYLSRHLMRPKPHHLPPDRGLHYLL